MCLRHRASVPSCAVSPPLSSSRWVLIHLLHLRSVPVCGVRVTLLTWRAHSWYPHRGWPERLPGLPPSSAMACWRPSSLLESEAVFGSPHWKGGLRGSSDVCWVFPGGPRSWAATTSVHRGRTLWKAFVGSSILMLPGDGLVRCPTFTIHGRHPPRAHHLTLCAGN